MNATLDEAAVLETLSQIIDPELGCNIVDLGLIYRVSVADGHVKVTMTLTTPGCPMHESITMGVKSALLSMEGVAGVEVELVWDPPWHPSLMSEQARIALYVQQS
jgi:metal-sulfur cluster biosynthetic enzyme